MKRNEKMNVLKQTGLSMMRMVVIIFTVSAFALSANAQSTGNSGASTKKLGALSPKKALEYMKTVKNLVIVDVATAREYKEEHFEGAVNIHYTQMPERYNEIPKNSTVLLHCRLGIVVPRAYRVLLEKRPDLKEISYIDGAPLFKDYNNWLKQQGK